MPLPVAVVAAGQGVGTPILSMVTWYAQEATRKLASAPAVVRRISGCREVLPVPLVCGSLDRMGRPQTAACALPPADLAERLSIL